MVKREEGYCGAISGKAILAQGLYQKKGGHRFSAEVKVEAGTARIFVCDILTGEILADQYITENEFSVASLTYFGTDRNLYLGIEALTDDAVVYIDDAKVESIPDADVNPEKISDPSEPEPTDPDQTENPVTGEDAYPALISWLLFLCLAAFSVLRRSRRLKQRES